MVRLFRMPQPDPAVPKQMDFTSRRSAVMGTRGMVSCSQPLASEVVLLVDTLMARSCSIQSLQAAVVCRPACVYCSKAERPLMLL